MPTLTIGILYYWFSSFLLALLLYFPARNMMFTMRVRGLSKRLEREPTEEEIAKEKRGAGFWTGLIVILFAFLFNRIMFFQ